MRIEELTAHKCTPNKSVSLIDSDRSKYDYPDKTTKCDLKMTTNDKSIKISINDYLSSCI